MHTHTSLENVLKPNQPEHLLPLPAATGMKRMNHIYLTGCQRKTCSLPLAVSHPGSKPHCRDLLSAQALSYETEMFPMWECIPYFPSCPRNAGWEQDIVMELVSKPAGCWVVLGTGKQEGCSALVHSGKVSPGRTPPTSSLPLNGVSASECEG